MGVLARHVSGRIFRIIAFLVAALAASTGMAGDTVDKVVAKGVLRCGVSQSLPGFALQDGTGRWQGLNVEFCRALAAAVLGDADKVKIIPLSSAGRFPSLLTGQVDVLAHTATLTLAREATIGLEFAGIYFLDGQGFMVPGTKGASRVEDLDGATVCLEKGTTSEAILANVFQNSKLKYTPLALEHLPDLTQAFFSGRCQALLSDRSKLAAILATTPKGAEQFQILPGYFSKEPMGPVVRRGDEQWLTLVRWVLFALIEAEEQEITRDTVRHLLDGGASPAQRRFLLDSGPLGKSLGLPSGWVAAAIAATGNYGEIYARNLGEGSPLKIERGYNRLWKNGGLFYSPPFH